MTAAEKLSYICHSPFFAWFHALSLRVVPPCFVSSIFSWKPLFAYENSLHLSPEILLYDLHIPEPETCLGESTNMHVFSLSVLTFPLLSLLVSAHFNLISPPARGFDEDLLGAYPCGGQNVVSDNRSMFPLTGGTIQLKMGHDQAQIQVVLAMGNNPGDSGPFNVSLVPIFQEEGLGNFCLGDVVCESHMRRSSNNK